MLGTIRTDLIKKRFSKYILIGDQEIYYSQRKKLFEALGTQECEMRLIKNYGTTFWGHIKATVGINDESPVCRMIISDISSLKNLMEEVSRESAENDKKAKELEKYQMLLKASLESPKDMIILSIDKDYQYLFFNEAHKADMKNVYNRQVEIGINLLEQMTSE